MTPSRWELGSEFHWTTFPAGERLSWPAPGRWFVLARHALVALLQGPLARVPRTVWLPSYFCHSMTDYWRRFFPVRLYGDDPRRSAPEWDSLRPAASDVVVAVNYFGVRGPDAWYRWRRTHPCVLVEDHSHDPQSPWAMRSQADFVFSSLRKTLPIPDGAILWSPRGRRLPTPVSADIHTGSLWKLGAMMLKAGYLEGTFSAASKPVYRRFQRKGEQEFDASEVAPISAIADALLERGTPVEWRRRRRDNATTLLRALESAKSFQPLFTSWPRSAAPLGAVLVFPARGARDRMRAALEENQVYCPVHWPPTRSTPREARALADLLLTIPTDQRYDSHDMMRVARLLRKLS